MKILGIRFQNLNSLKGVHEIRFDQSPFAESGLFAITGPTGAGKTTSFSFTRKFSNSFFSVFAFSKAQTDISE